MRRDVFTFRTGYQGEVVSNKIVDRVTHLLHPLRRWWTGRVVRRREPTGVLFVCQGNLCRSPYAAGLLNNFMKFGDRDLDVTSAGFMTEIPTPPAMAINV